MNPEKQTNYVRDAETPKHDITPSSLEEGPIEVISGGGEKCPQSPVTETPKLEIWNKPRINMYRYLSTLYTFIIMGMNDAAYGVSLRSSQIITRLLRFSQALIPYVSTYQP
jgi:hypothetical protein